MNRSQGNSEKSQEEVEKGKERRERKTEKDRKTEAKDRTEAKKHERKAERPETGRERKHESREAKPESKGERETGKERKHESREAKHESKGERETGKERKHESREKKHESKGERPESGRGERPESSRERKHESGRGERPESSRERKHESGRGERPESGRGPKRPESTKERRTEKKHDGDKKRGPTHIPKYCLYLYVGDNNGLCPALEAARNGEWCQNWGGLHLTLSSFAAAEHSSAKYKHGGNLKKCVHAMHAAGAAVAKEMGMKVWRLPRESIDGWYCDSSSKIIIALVVADTVLQAILLEQKKYKLSRGDEKIQQLHLTLGPAADSEKYMVDLIGKKHYKELLSLQPGEATDVPGALMDELCKLEWELLVVKDRVGVSPHTVTDKEDRMPLVFEEAA